MGPLYEAVGEKLPSDRVKSYLDAIQAHYRSRKQSRGAEIPANSADFVEMPERIHQTPDFSHAKVSTNASGGKYPSDGVKVSNGELSVQREVWVSSSPC